VSVKKSLKRCVEIDGAGGHDEAIRTAIN
jgi:hypothetical protein